GEMEKIRMNQVDMQRAAEQSRGKFYTLADAARLLDDLPAGSRIALHTPGPPGLLWNHFGLLFFVLGRFGGTRVVRNRKHLLEGLVETAQPAAWAGGGLHRETVHGALAGRQSARQPSGGAAPPASLRRHASGHFLALRPDFLCSAAGRPARLVAAPAGAHP